MSVPPRSTTRSVPTWLQTGAAVCWRLLVVGAVVLAVLHVLSLLSLIVLPVVVALLATTLLYPPFAWLRRRRLPSGAAAAVVLVLALLFVGGALGAIAPIIAAQVDDFGAGIQDGIRQLGNLLEQAPLTLTIDDLRARLDAAIGQARENSGAIVAQLQSGAVLIGEVLTGILIAILLTFFFLKDGGRMWDWLLEFSARDRRPAWDELGGRIFTALGGYVRGIALVGLVDAVLIGIALVIIGVPLVLPLMVLTFFGAFLPLVGAFLAGLAAVLIALVSNGVVAALLVLGAIVLVQQVEGNLLYPLLMGRTVHLHPAVILVALTIGGVLAGIVGVFLAVPVAAVLSIALDFYRHGGEPPPPATSDGASGAVPASSGASAS
jgi:predicted PurR-regulated permease PerM